MATMTNAAVGSRPVDYLSGTPRAHALDRWIYVVNAGLFILIVLTGFIPDSVMKIEMVRAGQRAPFPMILHVHAVLMGAYLVFLFSQTWLVATGRTAAHRVVGPVGGVLAVALVIVGMLLAPGMYWAVAEAALTAPLPAREALTTLQWRLDNVLLLQTQAGLLFSAFVALGLAARNRDAGFHKRMMIIAPAMAIGAAFARMPWLPHTMPDSPLSIQAYSLLSLAPILVWDLARNRRIHRAYWVLAAGYLPLATLVHLAWDTPWWHATARSIMGV